jgi:8-oxo-dGTP pyrophosphatase MutT (NUDIX family)
MRGYIGELRRLIGHRPLIIAGATVLPLTRDSRLLLIKRRDNGFWGPPGGMLEPGETLEETARRETLEEAGIEVKDLEFFGFYSGPRFHYTYPNGDEVYMVTVVYLTRLEDEKVAVGQDEHSEYLFCDLQRLPEGISPTIQPILDDLIASRVSSTARLS